MKIAVGYTRVSTQDQAQEGVSLEAQEQKIRAWALLNDYHLAAIYSDAGISGKEMDNRPGLQAALKECKKGVALVTYSLSRLSRTTRHALDISAQLSKAGADLVSVSEKIDTSSPAGQMVFTVLAAIGQFERQQISERTRMALQYKKSQGQRTGHIPFGSRLAADGVHLEECPEEQAILQTISTLQQQGLSTRRIAEELNARGMTNRSNPWQRTAVHRILQKAA